MLNRLCRVTCVGIALLLAGAARPVVIEAQVITTDDMSAIFGRYNVSYVDAELGTISGVAVIEPVQSEAGLSKKDVSVRVWVRHPRSNIMYALVGERVRYEGGDLIIELVGSSPSNLGLRSSGPVTEIRADLDSEIRVTAGGATAPARVGSGARVTLRMTATYSEVRGTWTQPRDRDGVMGQRMGVPQGSGTVGGTETWKRDDNAFIRSAKFVDIDYREIGQRIVPGSDPDVVKKNAGAFHGYGYLSLDVRHYPTKGNPEGYVPALLFDDPLVRPLGLPARTNGVDMRVPIGFHRDVQPGPKVFSLDGLRYAADLVLPSAPASVVAWFDGRRPNEPNPERTDILTPGQAFFVQYDFQQKPFFSRRLVKVAVGDEETRAVEVVPMPDGPQLRSLEIFVIADGTVDTSQLPAGVIPVRANVGAQVSIRPADEAPPDESYHLPSAIYKGVTGRDKIFRNIGMAEVIDAPITSPVLRFVAPGSPGKPKLLADIVPNEPFQIELVVPRDMASRMGTSTAVEFNLPAQGKKATWTLTSAGVNLQPSVRGPVTYRVGLQSRYLSTELRDYLTLRDLGLSDSTLDAAAASVLGNAGLAHSAGDWLVAKAAGIETEIRLFLHRDEAEMFEKETELMALHDFYDLHLKHYDRNLKAATDMADGLGLKLPVPEAAADKLIIRRRLTLVAHALQIMHRDDLLWSTKVRFARDYLAQLDTPAVNNWTYGGEWPVPRLGVTAIAVEEFEMLKAETREAQDRRSYRITAIEVTTLKAFHDEFTIMTGGYAVWAAAGIFPDLKSRGLNGEELGMGSRLMAGVQLIVMVAAIPVTHMFTAPIRATVPRLTPMRLPGARIGDTPVSYAARTLRIGQARDAVLVRIRQLGIRTPTRALTDEYILTALERGVSATDLAVGEAVIAGMTPSAASQALGISEEAMALFFYNYSRRMLPDVSAQARFSEMERIFGGIEYPLEAIGTATERTLTRLGMLPPDARAASHVPASFALDHDIAVVAAAWHHDIPVARVMRDLNISREVVEQHLNYYLKERQHLPNDVRVRDVARYMRSEARAIPNPQQKMPADSFDVVLGTVLSEMAPNYRGIGFENQPFLVSARAAGVPWRVAAVGGAWRANVNRITAMEHVELAADQFAAHLDDFMTRVVGIRDTTLRARMIRQYMRESTPPQYVRNASLPPSSNPILDVEAEAARTFHDIQMGLPRATADLRSLDYTQRWLAESTPAEQAAAVGAASMAARLGVRYQDALRYTAFHAARPGVTLAELVAESAFYRTGASPVPQPITVAQFAQATGIPQTSARTIMEAATRRIGGRMSENTWYPR